MKINFLSNKNKNSSAGFTLFIAMIVTSILLAVGFSIGNIVFKQILLSSSGKESQRAFYAADSVGECALYYDRKDASGANVDESPFATTTSTLGDNQPCGQGLIRINTPKQAIGDIATTTFYLDVNGSCGKATVVRNGNLTTVDARGYNSTFNSNPGVFQCDLTNARTVERGLQINF